VANPFVGEVRAVGFDFAPTGWALCNGQLLPISQNTALFSLLGTNYGGDGKSTFALPNLQGSFALNAGNASSGTQYFVGEAGGESTVTLSASEMPAHVHGLQASTEAGTSNSPSNASWGEARFGRVTAPLYAASGATASMAGNALAVAGGSQPHNNMPPYLIVNFIIALQGVFPPRS
jgi:microcystin-dependent protein